MIHLGDITQLHGDEIPVVDIITGGSPCQDLSVAGKRAGLDGERSGLFMEQIRIVKEMRERDRRNGRSGWFIRPRFMVWENVPGAFSSSKGRDFQAVLTEIVKIAEPDAPDVPMPEGGRWSKAGCLYSDMGAWSIAWRVHDAQFWGVPQRRKRIALVADFGGLAAPEILFERKGLSGDPESCGTARENAAGEIGGGFDSAIEEPPVDGLYKGTFYLGADTERVGTYPAVARSITRRYDGSPCIDRGPNIVMTSDAEPTESRTRCGADGASAYCLQGNGIDRADTAGCNGRGWCEGVSYTLNTIDRPAVVAFKQGQGAKAGSIGAQEECSPTLSSVASGTNQVPAVVSFAQNQVGEVRTSPVSGTLNTNSNATGRNAPLVYDARGNGDGKTAPTMTGDHQNRVTDYTALCVGNGQLNQMSMAEQSNTLDTMHDQQAVMIAAVDCRNATENSEVNGTLQAKEQGQNLNSNNVCRIGSTVRRLTPTECERLQGFPDGWTDIGEWVDSKGKKHRPADSPRYKALGNSIALPFWAWMARRICAQYERPMTMGSLFDGIGGFPLVFERAGAKAIWASEIEEFQIAVTKLHFPEERRIK